MADATLPQTKYAQKLKAYEGELPSYIHAIDDLAARAGLTIRHLRDRDYIVLVYSGHAQRDWPLWTESGWRGVHSLAKWNKDSEPAQSAQTVAVVR